jgi:UrcA family protein
MKQNICTMKMKTVLATVTILMLGLAPALASDENDKMEEIIVQAPMSVERKALHSAADPTVKTEVVELTRKVYIGDLDLSKHADVKELESRIEQMAKDSCKKLNAMFPLGDSRSRDARRCVERAIKSAMAEKQAAITAAQ